MCDTDPDPSNPASVFLQQKRNKINILNDFSLSLYHYLTDISKLMFAQPPDTDDGDHTWQQGVDALDLQSDNYELINLQGQGQRSG